MQQNKKILPKTWNVCRVCVVTLMKMCMVHACVLTQVCVCVCVYVKGKEKVEALSHRWSPENKHEVQNTHTRVSFSRKVKDQVESNRDPSERST